MSEHHGDRRESRAGDGDVVKLILSRFDDLAAQIQDVRGEQGRTNEYLKVQNGRIGKLEVAHGKIRAVVGAIVFAVSVGGLGITTMNFLKIGVADLAKLVGG